MTTRARSASVRVAQTSFGSPSCLYDTSWTAYRITWTTKSSTCQKLLTRPTSRSLKAQQLQEHLRSTGDEPEEIDESAGGESNIKSCTWNAIEKLEDGAEFAEVSMPEGRSCGLYINMVYEKAVYKAAIVGESTAYADESSPIRLPLLLVKAPAALTRKLLIFLADNLHAKVQPMKLPSSLLQSCLHNYLSTFASASAQSPVEDRRKVVRNVIKDLKISLAFSVPTAPELKAIDVDIPLDTARQLFQASDNGKAPFMPLVAAHLRQHTGIILPPPSENVEDTPVVRVSKIVNGAFALSVDGRIKIVGKAFDVANVDEMGYLVTEANEGILNALVQEAAKHVVRFA